MPVRVDQAVFGEVGVGHGLKAASGDARLAMELAPRLDIPDTAPTGADWSPFVSGFPFRDHYVLARTFKDPSARRSGMVLSHALIAPLQDMAGVSDLGPFWSRLLISPNASLDPIALEVDLDEAEPVPAGELVGAAVLLATRDTGTVVRVGHDGFELLISGIWRGLPPSLRRKFAFRLSFGPGDLTETPTPAMVCTPTNLIGRWHGHRVITSEIPTIVSPAAALLSGALGGQAFGEFVAAVGAKPESFAELSLLSEAYRLGAGESASLGDQVAAMRLVGRLSPDPSRGVDGKADLMRRARSAMTGASANDILRLRNLDLGPFTAALTFWEAMEVWMTRYTFPEAEDQEFWTLVAAAATPEDAVSEWRAAVSKGLRAAAHAGRPAVIEAFWRIAGEQVGAVGPLWRMFGVDSSLEESFLDHAPASLSPGAASTLLDLAGTSGLVRLHGLLASWAFDPAVAVDRQLSIEGGTSTAGLLQALRAATPEDLVAIALDTADPRLIDIAAEAVVDLPILIRALDYGQDIVQRLWLECSLKLDALWQAPADPVAAFHKVLDGVLVARPIALALVERLAASPLADVLTYPRRMELWDRLPAPSRPMMLAATATAWLEDERRGEAAPEPQLEFAILSNPGLDAVLTRLGQDRPGEAVELIRVLEGFTETRFLDWLEGILTSGRALTETEAEAIGGLIEARGWRRGADSLVTILRTYSRDDVRPALRACRSQVGFFDVWLLNLAPITANEKWAQLEAEATRLFPGGPDDEGLWERAGGRNADLTAYGTGASRWRNALQRLQRGRQLPRINRLLKEMRRDFPQNPALKLFERDNEFDDRE